MKVIIVGGGIGGLSLALSLHHVGIESYVFESSPKVELPGLGISLQPIAVFELTELGLDGKLAQVAIRTEELAYYNSYGKLVWSELRGTRVGNQCPQYSISRGALQKILLEAVRKRLGEDHVLLGHHLSSFEQLAGKIQARFVDPNTSSDVGSYEGDLLVGADGFHSVVRRTFYPDDKPQFEGIVNFRGGLLTEPFLSGKTMVIVGDREQRLIAFPISSNAMDGGQVLVNWICVTRTPREVLPREEWGREADRTKFFQHFADWVFPWMDVSKLIRMTSHVWEFPDVDRNPIPQWSFGRITLLGDAAHPMLPVDAQGGSQAIVDGAVLTGALVKSTHPEEALRSYQAQRKRSMNAMIMRNRF